MYKIDSPHATEFIDDAEIRDTLEYAEAKKTISNSFIRSLQKPPSVRVSPIVRPPYCCSATTLNAESAFTIWPGR